MKESFLNEEIRDGYTVSGEIKGLWSIQLQLLEKFIGICNECDLKYYAMFGTMLGAVRHGGYIPWDDDIDIVMPRHDYDRLSKMTDAFKYPFFLQTPENDESAFPRFMRLKNSATTFIPSGYPNAMSKGGNYGCGIDILPLDDVPSKHAALRIAKSAARCQKLREKCVARKEMSLAEMPEWKRKQCRMLIPHTYRELTKRYYSICTGYHLKSEKMPYYTIPVLMRDYAGLIFEKSLFCECVAMKFENLSIQVPSGYEKLIERIWDNGAALPELSDRKPKHKGFIDTNTPFQEYMPRYTDVFKNIDGKEILLFGAGDTLRIYMERYGDRYPPKCTFDNDRKKWGKELHGVSVCNPANIPDMLSESTRLIIISIYNIEIGEQLRNMGINDYYVFIDGWKY